MQVKGKVKVGEAMIEFVEGSGDAVVLIPGGGLDATISTTSAGASHEGSDLDLSRRRPDTAHADVLKGNGLVRATSPFSERIPERRVTWLEPKLIAEVSYAEIMHGDALRAALFRGFV
jgi:ATP dependent DNA ligase C terminal region